MTLNLWRGRDERTGRDCSLSVLSSDNPHVKCLHRTLKRFRGLAFTSLLPVHELVSDDDWVALVIGEAPLRTVECATPVGYQELIPQISGLLLALESLHAQGITHGCLNLSHILRSESGKIVLVPPLQPETGKDDVVELGRLLLAILTGDGADEDVSEPNHRVELLKSGIPVPALLNQVVSDMLAGVSPGIRDVRRRFDDVTRMGASENINESPATPVAVPSEAGPSRLSAAGRSIILLVIAAVGALVWIVYVTSGPRTIPDDSPRSSVPRVTGEGGASSGEPSPITAEEDGATPSLRDELNRKTMESALDEWLDAHRVLEGVGGDKWGGEKYLQTFSHAKQADSDVLNAQLLQAAEKYAWATEGARELYIARDEHFARLLDDGNSALEKQDAVAASQAFRYALLIKPNHELAAIGKQRAKTLDNVLDLLQTATAEEGAGRLETARDLFARALELDPHDVNAKGGLSRIDSIVDEQKFNTLMSASLQFYETGDLASAKRTLSEAAALRPAAAAVKEFRKTLETATRLQQARELERNAVTAEQDEDWQEALELYRQILNILPASTTAQTGKSRVETVITLSAQLLHYIGQPDLLFRDDVRSSARLVLEEVKELGKPSKRLQTNTAKLLALIERAETPVPVRIRSDGQTEVTILRIKNIGGFESRELMLRPGIYTFVGQRSGYRDVRSTLNIEPGSKSTVFTIQCTEPIF